jgi:hypothetical protein
MKIWYYREGRSDLDISDNDEGGLLDDFIEVDDVLGREWLDKYNAWCQVVPSIFGRIQRVK